MERIRQNTPALLFVSDNFPPVIGGSAMVYDRLCRLLQDHSGKPGAIRVVALSSTHGFDGAEKAGWRVHDRTCGYPIHRRRHLATPQIRPVTGLVSRLHNLLDEVRFSTALLFHLVRTVRREKIDIICLGELLTLGWLAGPLRWMTRRPVILYTHGEEITQQVDTIFGRRRGRFLANASHVIAVSRFCRSQILERYGVEPSHVSVVPNGVDLNRFTAGARDQEFHARFAVTDGPLVVAAGRHVERKGFDYLIEAMPLVQRHFPTVRLVLAGTGPLTPHLKARCADLDMDGIIRFTGPLSDSDLVRLYRAADLFAMPNRTMPDGDTEGFGLVFLEAAACGLPSLAGRAGGAVEAVIDGTTGCLVQADTPGAVADALIRLLGQPDLLQAMRAAARPHAETFSWENSADCFVKVLQLLDKAQ
ncbi:glycosyltransferase family 4 protein [Eilatimonas milleporae]|uniref:Phosphatidylinositol alpha-1,6-mannosyltransferase n=1 Tax=Eilatimonas milleporae TaxID=911205 RepID=A0A3M0BVQ3_9PROT|nr:glycosyltransferase family 4 protein [Eilatimonas milleporae]RMB01468.1 phosphatidylinositol alpha-1,6-mannosyltransferase [Eilatimonas milleporae]